jgi:beta-lactamase regulating signal transducer with metallopeptidase domain
LTNHYRTKSSHVSLHARAWSRDDLCRALIHELEHVARADWAGQCAARIACAIYWFHPLVWMAWRELAIEAERACDDAVLRRAEPDDYASQLVGLARRLEAASHPPLPPMKTRRFWL